MRKWPSTNNLSELLRWNPSLYILTVLFLFGGVFLSTHGPTLVSQAFTNYGMLLLLAEDKKEPYATVSPGLEQARSLLQSAAEWDPTNVTVRHGLAFIYWQIGEDEHALQEWERAGYTGDDFVVFAHQLPQQLVEIRYRWYHLAEKLKADTTILWLDLGVSCQREQTRDDELCQHFLVNNNQNWLVDTDFVFNRTAWLLNRREGVAYEIGPCSNLTEKRCAVVSITDKVPEFGASWYQCGYIESGKQYRFSAWLKVIISGDGQWRPLYAQGNIDSETRGFWPGDQEGSIDWQYWERTFTAPEFDNGRACFHPIILKGQGKSWFHSATLTQINP